MIGILRTVAALFGAQGYFERYEHHLPRMGRVIVIGGVGFLIQTILFEVLGIWTKVVNPSTATVIGAEFAILTNFYLNNRFSFRDAAKTDPLFRRLVRFHIVVSGSLVIQWICVFVTERFTSHVLLLNLAFLFGVGVGFLLNYTGYYLFVWRRGSIHNDIKSDA